MGMITIKRLESYDKNKNSKEKIKVAQFRLADPIVSSDEESQSDKIDKAEVSFEYMKNKESASENVEFDVNNPSNNANDDQYDENVSNISS